MRAHFFHCSTKKGHPLSLRDDCRDAGGRATQEQLPRGPGRGDRKSGGYIASLSTIISLGVEGVFGKPAACPFLLARIVADRF
ncbi:MAG: hypothetical protein OEY26_09245, partial [Nitrospinota bacterium]|nr:hypothetical protein [Nitrospinota bacterium]